MAKQIEELQTKIKKLEVTLTYENLTIHQRKKIYSLIKEFTKKLILLQIKYHETKQANLLYAK